MSDVPVEPGGISYPVLDWRLRQTEEALKGLRTWRGQTDVKMTRQESSIESLHDDVKDIKKQVKSVQRLLIGLMSSITLATITFSVSLLAATGRL
jgi:hypothetical protein